MRYIIGILITIGLIILILVLLLRGGGSSPAPATLNLLDYTDNGQADLMIDGPVVSEQKHQELKIAVNSSNVTFTAYNGYQDSVIKQSTYANNDKSFEAFLKSLQHAGFTQGSISKSLRDERGYCPTGRRYIYVFSDGSKQLMRFWSTSCGDPKTFKGSASAVQTLFKTQVPDFNDQVEGLSVEESSLF